MQVFFRGFNICQWCHTQLRTHLYTNGSQIPAFSPDFLKLHTQTVSMSHTYLKFNMTKHCSLCIFCPVAAIVYHLATNARNPGVLESSLSFMPHHPSANSGFQIFLASVFSSLFFLHCPSGFHPHLPRQLPQRLTWSCSRLVPLKSPSTPISRHKESRMPWTFIACRIKFTKANTALQSQGPTSLSLLSSQYSSKRSLPGRAHHPF